MLSKPALIVASLLVTLAAPALVCQSPHYGPNSLPPCGTQLAQRWSTKAMIACRPFWDPDFSGNEHVVVEEGPDGEYGTDDDVFVTPDCIAFVTEVLHVFEEELVDEISKADDLVRHILEDIVYYATVAPDFADELYRTWLPKAEDWSRKVRDLYHAVDELGDSISTDDMAGAQQSMNEIEQLHAGLHPDQ